jgi:hypothetical protein
MTSSTNIATTELYAKRTSLKQRELEASDELWERVVDERLVIEDEILAAPITNVDDIAMKVEIVTVRSKNFDNVSDELERLRGQIIEYQKAA